jgi:hypothetical protein
LHLSNKTSISAIEPPRIKPPAMPWTARAAISDPMSGATALAMVAARNTRPEKA